MPTSVPPRWAIFSSDSQTGWDTTGESDEYPGLSQEGRDIAKNLAGRIQIADIPVFPRINGKPAVSEDILKDFLAKIHLYSEDDVRWARIPEYPRYGSDLRSPIVSLVTAVIAHMAAESTYTDGSTRSIAETWNVRLAAPGQPASTRWCSPSLSIVATGPSFELPESGPIGYTNIAACIQVVTEENKRCQEQHIFELGVFAKQILLQQPNRDAVRLMYMTEDRAALVQFDRAGVQSTREVWYHLEPETFIHFIFAICAFDEKDLGFDDTIRWTFSNGKKVAGHVDVTNENGVRTGYPMRSLQPIIARSDIHSRGMRIWAVTDPLTGRNLIVKDTWLPSNQRPESEYLGLVRGVEGLVQLIGEHFSPCPTILEMRSAPTEEQKASSEIDLTRHRIVLEEYGDRVVYCEDERKVLEAFRDGVAALQRLNELGLLHRDISPGNFLLGVEGAEPGWRGVVIDLDMAHAMDGSKERNECWGTRGYMSLNVLRGRINPTFATGYLRDHLDDLESTFWTFCQTTYGWTDPECHVGMRQFADFAHCDRTSYELKDAFFQAKAMVDTSKVLNGFGSPTKRVLEEFFSFLKEMNEVKLAFDDIADPKKRMEARLQLAGDRDNHYKRILAFFDKALARLDAPSIRKPLGPMKINLPSFLKR